MVPSLIESAVRHAWRNTARPAILSRQIASTSVPAREAFPSPSTANNAPPRFPRLSEASYNSLEVLDAATQMADKAAEPVEVFEDYKWPERMFDKEYRKSPGNQYSGRTVDVRLPAGPGGFAQAYRRLSIILGKNKVKKELRLAEYYEKPSNMRRRLEMERHRRRFQELVRQKVQLVQTIKNRRQ